MTNILRVSDGSKAANFDGFVLEVSGISGSSNARRLAIESIEAVMVADAKDEVMFGVRSRKGGFSLFVSQAKREEWQALAHAVMAARATLP
jgi:hypothetical protein